MSAGVAPQLLAEFGHEVRKFDEANVRTAPKMVVDLGYGGDPQACVLQRIFDILGLGTARLDPKQSYDGAEAVLDAVAHLPGEQRLMFERLFKPGVGLLAFDRDTEQGGKASKKIDVVLIELARIGAVDFKHTEEGFAFSSCAIFLMSENAPESMKHRLPVLEKIPPRRR